MSKLELLEWVIKLTYTGMPLSMFRRLLIKKHEELSKDDNPDDRNTSDLPYP